MQIIIYNVSITLYIYIYMYRERERERSEFIKIGEWCVAVSGVCLGCGLLGYDSWADIGVSA